jgi:hypothetical protein
MSPDNRENVESGDGQRWNCSPPQIHNLTRLAELGQLDSFMSQEQNDFIDALLPLNIEARYPVDKNKLLGVLTENYCREVIAKTEDLMIWIKNRL